MSRNGTLQIRRTRFPPRRESQSLTAGARGGQPAEATLDIEGRMLAKKILRDPLPASTGRIGRARRREREAAADRTVWSI